MMWWNDGFGVWGWLGMALMMALVWVPILLLTVWFLSSVSGRSRDGTPSRPDPIEAARLAYARGEITRERYLQIVDDLSGRATQTRDKRGAA